MATAADQRGMQTKTTTKNDDFATLLLGVHDLLSYFGIIQMIVTANSNCVLIERIILSRIKDMTNYW